MKKRIMNCFAAAIVATSLVSCDAMPNMYPPNQPQQPNYGGGGSIGQNNGGYRPGSYGGNYTNAYDANRSAEFRMQLNSNGQKVEGTATYESANGNSSGMMSVIGSLDGNVARLSFIDQRGNTIATGVLSQNENRFTFIQNTSTNWVPRETILDRGR